MKKYFTYAFFTNFFVLLVMSGYQLFTTFTLTFDYMILLSLNVTIAVGAIILKESWNRRKNK